MKYIYIILGVLNELTQFDLFIANFNLEQPKPLHIFLLVIEKLNT